MRWLLALLLQLACKLFLLTFVFELLLLLQLSLLLLLDDDWVQGALCLMSFLFFSSTLLMTVLALFILNPLLVSYYHFYKCPKIIAVENFSRSKIIAKLTLCFAMSTVCTTTQLWFSPAFLRSRVLPQTTVSLALPPTVAAVVELLLFFHCLFSLLNLF